MISLQHSKLQEVQWESLNNLGNRLFIKRDDLIHPEISGNKWRKLEFNIEHAKQMKKEGILTFGGAYSNHLLATASACKMHKLKSIGIVRGNELNKDSNSVLRRCNELGMELIFISRELYSLKNEKSFHEELSYEHPMMFIVPEGGANYFGMIGCQKILKEIEEDFDIVAVAQGTTTTSCGLTLGLTGQTRLWVFPVLKGFKSKEEMGSLMRRSGFDNESILDYLDMVNEYTDYHFGGYGVYNDKLLDFLGAFYLTTGVPLDPVYTGKAMFGLINEVINQDLRNKKILFVHTGGIEGGKEILVKEKRRIY